MKCPKCGYVRQNRDNVFAPPTECPACGVVYAKYLTSESGSAPTTLDGLAGIKKSSPISEESLKQARERVERRLRKKFNPQEKDEFREQTLQRARLFVAEGVKKRREEAQLSKGEEPEAAQDQGIDPEAQPSPADAHPLEASPVSEDIATAPSAAPGETDMIHANEPAGGETTGAFEAQDVPAETQEAPAEAQAFAPAEPQETTAVDDETAAGGTFQMGQEDLAHPAGEEPQPFAPATDANQASIEPPAAADPAVVLAALSTSRPHGARGSAAGLMRLLPVAAWLILVAGVMGAVLSWTTLNDVQAGMSTADPAMDNRLPVALLLGFAYLATGVLGFAFFWVSAIINTQLREIRLLLHSASQEPDNSEAADGDLKTDGGN
jgi:hypothetical protein